MDTNTHAESQTGGKSREHEGRDGGKASTGQGVPEIASNSSEARGETSISQMELILLTP